MCVRMRMKVSNLAAIKIMFQKRPLMVRLEYE
jgi:hypothetical protein